VLEDFTLAVASGKMDLREIGDWFAEHATVRR